MPDAFIPPWAFLQSKTGSALLLGVHAHNGQHGRRIGLDDLFGLPDGPKSGDDRMFGVIRFGVNRVLSADHFDVFIARTAADHVSDARVKGAACGNADVLDRTTLRRVHVNTDGTGVALAEMDVDATEDLVVRRRASFLPLGVESLKLKNGARR